MMILSNIYQLVIKLIKILIFLLLIILLSPILLFNSFFILNGVINAPPNYERQGTKGQALYEFLAIFTNEIILIYKKWMNEKVSNNNILDSQKGKNLAKIILYSIGIILFTGSMLNMCISGYYILYKNEIKQENIEIREEFIRIREAFENKIKTYDSKNIIYDHYNKIAKTEEFCIEYKFVKGEDKNFYISIMQKNDFNFWGQLEKERKKTLLFKKNEYLCTIELSGSDDVVVLLRRDDFYRDSKFHDILSPIIFLTSGINPLKYFEKHE